MRHLLLQMILIILLSFIAFGQTPTPTPDRSRPVTVDQGFVDDATKAFELVAAQKETIQKFINERGRTEAERQAGEALIKGLNDFLALKDRMISQYELLVNRLQTIVDFQFKIIEKLKEMMNKPKGFWQKLFDGVKEILKAATYIMIGRGIGYLIKEYDPDRGILRIRPRTPWERMIHKTDRGSDAGLLFMAIAGAGGIRPPGREISS